MDHFEFLDKVEVGDEVLTSKSATRIHKVIGVNDKFISIDSGIMFERETGMLWSKGKNQSDIMLLHLTDEQKQIIERQNKEKEENDRQEQKQQAIKDEFIQLVGDGYRHSRPSLSIQKEVIKLIKKLKEKESKEA